MSSDGVFPGGSLRRSLTSSLPPLGSAAAAAAIAAAHASLTAPHPPKPKEASSGSGSAAAYKAFPTELGGSLRRASLVDRSAMSEKRRLRRASQEAKQQQQLQVHAQQAMLAPLPMGGDATQTTNSLTDPHDFEVFAASSSIGADPIIHPALFGSRPATAGGMRLPTPLPAIRPGSSGIMAGGAIDLNLPLQHQQTPSFGHRLLAGSQSARSPTSTSGLAAITQDTNTRVANFLSHYDGHRRSDSSMALTPGATKSGGAGSKSHRLILDHMSLLTPQQLIQENEISRVLTNWHPVKSAKSFTSLSNKIRSIISDRSALFEGHFSGKILVEDAGFVSEELEKRKAQYFKILVPNNVNFLKVDLDVTQGRIEMNISVGEPVHPGERTGKDKVQRHTWTTRAGVGHHSLTIHVSDANWRGGEYYYVTLYGIQSSSLLIKASLGGRSKNVGVVGSSSSVDGGVGDSSGPASSGTRLTARQAAAARQAPSIRNIRKQLEARVKALAENPKALKEFMQKVNILKKKGLTSVAQGSNNLYPPAHLSDRALHKLNEDADAAALAADAANSALTSPLDSSPSARSSPLAPHRGIEQKRIDANAHNDTRSIRPHPLTPTSLEYIPHIASIEGVAAVFYAAASDVRPAILDDHDCILLSAPSSPPPPLPSHSLSVTRVRSRDSVSCESKDSSPQPSPRVQQPNGVFARQFATPNTGGSTPASQAAECVGAPVDLSHLLQAFITKVCKRIKLQSMQLQSCSIDDVDAQDEARFLNRCLKIYQAHLPEIQHILHALATGDYNQPTLAKYLEPQMTSKNFLLVNAYDATDNKTHEPQRKERIKRIWHEEHKSRMEHADQRRAELESHKREQTLATIDRKEKDRAQAIADRAAVAAKLALQDLQRKWLRHLAAALRHRFLKDACQHLHPMRVESFRKNHAAKKLQHFIRMTLAIKRKTRASLHFQAFRSMVLLMATNYGAVKRDRAANCIKLFIEQKKGVDSVSRLIKNFRRRVGVCQRAFRRWAATRRAKLDVWRIQYDRAVTKMNNPIVEQDKATRERLLDELFTFMKRDAMARANEYMVAMSLYHARFDEEIQKKRIISDHVLDLLALPIRPKVPSVLTDGQLSILMDEALAASRDQALHNILKTAEQEAALPTNQPNPHHTRHGDDPHHHHPTSPHQHHAHLRVKRDTHTARPHSKRTRLPTATLDPHFGDESHKRSPLSGRSRSNSIGPADQPATRN